jgi:hypothetical protein
LGISRLGLGDAVCGIRRGWGPTGQRTAFLEKIYAQELEKAQADGRIRSDIVVDRAKPVDVGVDLGRADMTSLWFVQQVGIVANFDSR